MTAGYTLLFLFIAGQKQQLIVVELVELIKALDPPDLLPVVVLDVETLTVSDGDVLNLLSYFSPVSQSTDPEGPPAQCRGTAPGPGA